MQRGAVGSCTQRCIQQSPTESAISPVLVGKAAVQTRPGHVLQHKPHGENHLILYHMLQGGSIKSSPQALKDQGIGRDFDFQPKLRCGRQPATASLLAVPRTPLVAAASIQGFGLGNLGGLSKAPFTGATLISTQS